MSKYGKVINQEYEDFNNIPSMNIFENNTQYRDIINNILGVNMPFTKINNELYGTLVKTLLGKDNRYVFLTINGDNNPIGYETVLENVGWTSLQLRNVAGHVGGVKTKTNVEFNVGRNIPIKRYSVENDGNQLISNYKCVMNSENYKIVLLHTTDSEFEYVEDGSLISALTTWGTIISKMTSDELFKLKNN